MAVNACAPDSQSCFARLSRLCRVNAREAVKNDGRGMSDAGRYIFRPSRPDQGHYFDSRPELVMTEHRVPAL